ncbi:hypothetical protein ABPG74_016740 [Tetrahymena malaccensis]
MTNNNVISNPNEVEIIAECSAAPQLTQHDYKFLKSQLEEFQLHFVQHSPKGSLLFNPEQTVLAFKQFKQALKGTMQPVVSIAHYSSQLAHCVALQQVQAVRDLAQHVTNINASIIIIFFILKYFIYLLNCGKFSYFY